MPRARVVILLIGILALGGASLFWSLREGEGTSRADGGTSDRTAGSDRLRGPDVPPENALPGRLWVVVPEDTALGTRCQLRALDFERLELEPPGTLTHCTLVDVSTDGSYAVAYDSQLRLALLDLNDRPRKAVDLDPRLRDDSFRTSRIAAVAGDGTRVAWCAAPNETTVLTVDTGVTERAVGCDPRFGADRQLFTRTAAPLGDGILANGRLVLAPEDFREGLDLAAEEEASLLAYDVGSNAAIATKVRRVIGHPQTTIQIWKNEDISGFYPVSGLAPPLQSSSVELSPDTTRIALGWPGLLAGVLDFGFQGLGRTLDHGPYAWSPDGKWLAIGEALDVSVYARGSDAPTYTLPITTLMIAWSE